MNNKTTFQVTVTRIQPFGVFVTLAGGGEGYIRRKELTLSGDVPPVEAVKAGQTIEAVLLTPGDAERMPELSARQALPDPWKRFVGTRQVGEVVGGSVKYIYANKVIVEISPGVDGEIYAGDLADGETRPPDAVVWVGDRLEAVITHIDRDAATVRLSVRARLEQTRVRESLISGLYPAAEKTQRKAPEAPRLAFEGECRLPGTLVVVEDKPDLLKALIQWLAERSCQTVGFERAAEALPRCLDPDCSLVIADLDMPGMDGLTFVSELRGQGYAGPIAVMSVPDIIEKTLESLNTLGVSAAFVKPLDLNEVCRFLAAVKAGSPPDLSQLVAEMRRLQRLTADRPPVARETTPTDIASTPLGERLLEGLNYLKGRTSAEKLAVFHRDPTSKKIELAAAVNCPALGPSQELGLRYSPVKDVIVEGTVINENEVKGTARARFRNLNRWLDFESCIGVPVVTGETCDHALFLFHRKPVMFNTDCLREAQAIANQFGVAIERIALAQERLAQRISILTGEITSAFNHEVFNKVCTLDVFVDTLQSGLSEGCDPDEIRLRAAAVRDLANDLKLVLEEFPKISQAKDDDASINEVIAFAADELRERAQRAGAKIRLHLDEHLPEAAGSQPGFHHICINLILNAIQQMELSRSPLRLLEVTSFYDRNDPALPIKVRFTDTGPGVHRQHWDEIFKLGFTTRPGGTGLGLYIARSLVGGVNGRLTINESWIGAGTQFLLELPVYGSLPAGEIPSDTPAYPSESFRGNR